MAGSKGITQTPFNAYEFTNNRPDIKGRFNRKKNDEWQVHIGAEPLTNNYSTPSKGANAMGEEYNDPDWMNNETQSPSIGDQRYWSKFMGYSLPEDDGSYIDEQNEVNLDPFQDFKFGMNMPTFQLGKGVLDTGSNLMNVFNQFRNYGLRKDMFGKQMEMADKQYDDEKEIQNIKFNKMDFNRAERNNFKKAYGGADGNYLMEDPVSRRA